MVRNNVSTLLQAKFGSRKINLREVQRETGLTYDAIIRWRDQRITRVDFPTIEAWCKYFGCSVGDLLTYEAGSGE